MKIGKGIKRFALALGVVATGVLLTACGSNNSSSKGGYTSELKQSKQLTIGLEGTYAPYSYRQGGKLTGFEVDLGKAVAKKMNLKANFVPTKWDSLIAGLGSSKYDVVLNNIAETPERKKSYIFSTPYIYSRYALITKAGDKSIQKLSDVKGKKLAEGTGTNNEVQAKKLGAKTVPSGDFTTTLALIRQGRVQGTINAREAWFAYAKSNSTKGLTYHKVSDSQAEPVNISAMFNQKDTKLKAKFNKVLQQLRKDGTLTKLSQKYFGADITKK
ncbi:transporter substrate-binding domain-containing protein [Lentilactobacillus hilgardii]|nr:transporter substrate-binding domain-containing protein [Lentilactobacillus hilgardii]MCV3740116.1 transporter substrate-binding domain-containing protein [Lentilactobacillus hilgardii]